MTKPVSRSSSGDRRSNRRQGVTEQASFDCFYPSKHSTRCGKGGCRTQQDVLTTHTSRYTPKTYLSGRLPLVPYFRPGASRPCRCGRSPGDRHTGAAVSLSWNNALRKGPGCGGMRRRRTGGNRPAVHNGRSPVLRLVDPVSSCRVRAAFPEIHTNHSKRGLPCLS